jgi:NTE family protein
MDGGIRSSANVDLAGDAERVVAIAPLSSGGGPLPKPSTQLDALPASHKLLIVPDAAARSAFGRNPLDPAVRAPAAKAGFEQGLRVASAVADTWS